MSKFVNTKQLPENLRKGEYVVRFPDFKEEVSEFYSRVRSNFKLTTVSMLRNILGAIGNSYDPTFDFYAIPYNNFDGLKIDTIDELIKVVNNIVRLHAPSLYRKSMEFQIKNRPIGIKVIYFDGPFSYTDVFNNFGMFEIKEKDVDVELGLAEKKIPPKSAVKGSPKQEKKDTKTPNEAQ